MKYLFLAPLLTLFFMDCTNVKPAKEMSDRMLTFFPSGIYEAFESSNYCKAWDTLFITKDRIQDNIYHVGRNTAFERNLDEQYFPVEYETHSWNATYDISKNMLRALGDEGRNIYFIPEGNTLVAGDITYIKIE